MSKLFKERKLFKGGNYMRKYGKYSITQGTYNDPTWTFKSDSDSFLVPKTICLIRFEYVFT